MKVTKIWENIGWSFLGDAAIKMENNYTPSNDYIGSEVYINGEHIGGDCSERLALLKAFENYYHMHFENSRYIEDREFFEDLAMWLLRR